MWQSQDDVIRDLASLNDFGVPGDTEPYKILYSTGRGSKFKGKHRDSGKFLDTRTGEVIDTEEIFENIDSCHKGRGRGSLLSSFSRSKYQLQQQLRLARPLGSGDEAVELYYRRNHSASNSKSSGTSDSEPDIKIEENVSQSLNSSLNSSKTKESIKAVRKSSPESNALITGLLSKSRKNSKSTNTEGSIISDIDEENAGVNINSNCKVHNNCSTDSIGQIDSKEFHTEDSSLSRSNYEELDIKSKYCLKKSSCSCSSCSDVQKVTNREGLDIGGDDEDEKVQKKKTEANNQSTNEFFDSVERQKSLNEESKALGGKHSKLLGFYAKPKANGIYDFSQISRHIPPTGADFETNFTPVPVVNPNPDHLVINDDEFPPLNN